jgi:hypothetical protein
VGRAEEKLTVANQIDRNQDHQRRKPGNRLSYRKLCTTVHSPPFPLPQWDVLTGDTIDEGRSIFFLAPSLPLGERQQG